MFGSVLFFSHINLQFQQSFEYGAQRGARIILMPPLMLAPFAVLTLARIFLLKFFVLKYLKMADLRFLINSRKYIRKGITEHYNRKHTFQSLPLLEKEKLKLKFEK